MTDSPNHHKPTLDDYLDGVLPPEVRQAAERKIASDPALAAEVELQRRIDASLGRLFGEGGEGAAALDSLPAPARRLRLRPVVWSIAAAVLLAAGVSVYFVFFAGGPLRSIYNAQLAVNFEPSRVCTTAPEFADWVKQYYGEALWPPEEHPGIEFVGWNYGPAVSSSSGVLLARAQGREVIVVVDRKDSEKRPLPEPGHGLHSFRREYGSLVAYEVTPLDHAEILPLLSPHPGRGN